ncbi:MAG: hypothetical protein ACJ8LG_08270 [Massilia sp.]
MAHIGWTIQVTRCHYLDSKDNKLEAYAVNLVMPWPGELPAGGRGPAAPVPADPRLRKLLQPWTWEEPAWQVYARVPPAAWQPVGAPQALDTGVAGGALPADAVGAEVFKVTAGCDHAFSTSPDDIDAEGNNTRSLPHALAPLTHWPAGASNHGLRMAGFLHLDAAALAPFGDKAEIVCFPQFKLGGGPLLVPDIPVNDPNNHCELASYARDPDLVMASQPCPRTEPGWQQNLAQPDGAHDDLPRTLVRFQAARELAPLALLSRVAADLALDAEGPDAQPAARAFVESFAAPDAIQRNKWTEALWRFLGDGWEPPSSGDNGKRRASPHLLARLMPSSQASRLASIALTPSAAALERSISLLAQRPAGAAWTVENQRQWQRIRDDYAGLGQPFPPALASPLAQGLHYLHAWLEVARALQRPDSARQILGPWLLALAGGALPPCDPEQQDAALTAEKLNNAVLPESMVDLAALGLLSNFPVWDWIQRPPGANAAPLAALLLAPAPAPGSSVADLLAGYPGTATAVEAIASRFIDSITRRANPGSARPRDAGLVLRFESGDPGDGFDQSVRGYALALCAYVRDRDGPGWLADQGRAQWISDSAVWRQDSASWLETNNAVWWVHETIGSTTQNGLRATQAEYLGKPICAMSAGADGQLHDKDPVNRDPDGSNVIDFRWHADAGGRELPLLGYGLHYKGLVSCIDNAGGVIEPELRDPACCAQLKPATEIFPERLLTPVKPMLPDTPPQWHYRSAVPPGAPVARNAPLPAAYALSDETRAHAWHLQALRTDEEKRVRASKLVQASGPLPRVALLAHDQQLGSEPLYLANAAHAYEFTLEPPGASADFVERWLNTDIVLRERQLATPAQRPLGSLSDPAFADAAPAALRDFRDRIVGDIGRNGAAFAYHPAVSAIGVAVWVDGAANPFIHRFPLARTSRDPHTGVVSPSPRDTLQVAVRISSSAAPGFQKPEVSAPGDRPSMHITVPAGSFIRVRGFSLVDGAHFVPAEAGSADHRFYPGIELSAADEGVPEFPGTGPEPYRAFGPTEFWFEAAPRWDPYQAAFTLAVVQPGATLTAGDAPLAPDLLALKCDSANPATWVRSLFVQRHEWHWTGYPVRLPQGDALEDWLASLAGVESYREALEISLETGFKGNTWSYGPNASGTVVLQKRTLQQGARPARYAAFTARPMVRFHQWLNPRADAGPLGFERQVFAIGAVVPGVAPAGAGERLPTPPLRWAVPLTATYAGTSAAAGKPDRIESGNMLVFDDALRRTDQLSRFGGIGDTLEIDLLETRDPGFREIGVNPIFHPNPPAAQVGQFKLRQHPPFGLTNDNSSNALVSQSALVVSVEGAGGHWTMARIRVRRLILPETLANSELLRDAGRAILPTRIEGDDAVPLDFALDLDAALPWAGTVDPSLRVVLNPGGATELARASGVPHEAVLDPGQQLRYLFSWHKRRWDTGGRPTWRLQVLAQQRQAADLDWTTVDKLSGFSNVASEIPLDYQVGQVRLVQADPPRYRIKAVRMSDYTDPIWLTFIGSFGRERTCHPEQYRCDLGANGLQLSAPAGELPVLKALQGDDPCFHILLVYRPLVDITRGDVRNDTGALVGVYFYSTGHSVGFEGFMPMSIGAGPAPTDLGGCFSYLCAVQRITSPSDDEKKILRDPLKLTRFEQFVDQLFPTAGESTMRLLPEYLGPIPTGPQAG